MSSPSKRNKQHHAQGEQDHTPSQQQQPQENQYEDGAAVAMHRELRAGPIPDPETLQQYDEVLPGTADRIVKQFEKESEHRQAMENKIVDAQIEHQRLDMAAFRRGQVFAFTIAVVGLIGSSIGVYHAHSTGQAWAAASIGGVSLATLVGVFIYGRKAAPPQNEEYNPQKDNPQ